MFTQKDQELAYAMAIKEARGADAVSFDKKISWLKDKWSKAPIKNSAPARLICPILFRPTGPINISIVADNIDFYKGHFKEDDRVNLEKDLAIACLCGSRNVADFLLNKLGSNYEAKGRECILAYVAASMNKPWIEDIAKAMGKVRKDMPDSVFSLVEEMSIIDEIKAIFRTENLENKNSLKL